MLESYNNKKSTEGSCHVPRFDDSQKTNCSMVFVRACTYVCVLLCVRAYVKQIGASLQTVCHFVQLAAGLWWLSTAFHTAPCWQLFG